ncbi:MAG: hypothetical protein IKK00_07150 [Oscillospiraceae bacterium]|nr:hypothetical protein [Oscillospiraceae bacterium]
MTNTRRPNIQQHSARPAPMTAAPDTQTEDDEGKMEYIDFINKLMHRMQMDSIRRMLECALTEVK